MRRHFFDFSKRFGIVWLGVSFIFTPLFPALAVEKTDGVSSTPYVSQKPSILEQGEKETAEEQAPVSNLQVFQVVDEYRDIIDMGNGKKKMRIYPSPRQIYTDEQGIRRVREDGWNKFNEDTRSKLKAMEQSGYEFALPMSQEKEVLVIADTVEKVALGKKTETIPAQKAQFSQKNNEAKHTISSFAGIYPNVDVRFIDKKTTRTKEIRINTKPSDLQKDEQLVFWEKYQVPAGSEILIGEQKYTEQITTTAPVRVMTGQAGGLFIDSSIVFDSKFDDKMYQDLSRQVVEQIVVYDRKTSILKIGLVVPGEYLLSPERVYPVIVDPSYFTCDTTSCVTDFYLQWLSDKSTLTSNDLLAGYAYANGVGKCSPAGPASRHIVFKFNMSGIPTGSDVTDADVYIKGSSVIGCGSYTGSVPLKPKKINTSWDSGSITYSNIRSGLTDGGSTTSITPTTCKESWCSWDLSNTMVEGWVDGSNNGMLIEPEENWSSGTTVPTSWNNKQYLFWFYSSNYSNANSPYLDVEYTPPVVGKPDLKIYSKSLSDTTVTPGQTINAKVKIQNIGNASSKPTKIGYYYSSNDTCTLTDTFLAEDDVGGLSVNGISNEDDANITIPSNATVGATRYICFFADYLNNENNESDENNNTDYISVTIEDAPKPDLTKYSDSLVTTAYPGDTISGEVTIQNTGKASSGKTSYIYYYWKKDVQSYDSQDTFDQDDVVTLAAGTIASKETFSYTVPTDATPGTYYLSYFIDAPGDVAESDEGNNQYAWTVTVNALLKADLIVQSPNLTPNSVFPGDSINLSSTIKNNGTGLAFASKVGYYLSSNNVHDGSDKYLGFNDVSNLSGGSTSFEDMVVQIPSDTSPGTYYILFVADHEFNVTESNESNNVAALQITVKLKQTIDLAITSASVVNSGQVYKTGGMLSITAPLQNTGNTAANGVVYTLTLKDTKTGKLFSLTNPSPSSINMSSGYNQTPTLSGTIPNSCDMAMDAFYSVEVFIDSNNAFGETNENNNKAVSGNTAHITRENFCGSGDSDGDGISDVEEQYLGWDPVSPVSTPKTGPDASKYAATKPDAVNKNYAADPVNIRTGSFELTQSDIAFDGRGEDLNFTRVYNSTQVARSGRFGNGWDFSYNLVSFQNQTTKAVQIYLGEATIAQFTTNDSGATFVSPPGQDDILYWKNNQLVYQTLAGVKYTFSKQLTDNMAIVESIQDRNGNTVSLLYGSVKGVPLLQTVMDASGRTIQFTYGAADAALWDKVVQIKDTISVDNFRILTYAYDANMNLLEVKETKKFGGNSETITDTFTHDVTNRISTYTDPRGTVLYNTYDATGRVTQQEASETPGGSKKLLFTLTYEGPSTAAPGSSYCTLVKNYDTPSSFFSERVCFSAENLRIYSEDTAGKSTKITRNTQGMMTKITDEKGNVTQYEYDAKRRVIKEILPDTGAWHTERTFTYEDAFNQMTQTKEVATSLATPALPSVTKITTYSIDFANGNILSITDPLGKTQSYTHDNFGNILTFTDKNGNKTTYTYNASGNYRTSEAQTVTLTNGSPQTITHTYAYDGYGNKTSYTTPEGNKFTYIYDNLGNLREETNPLGGKKTYDYDAENHRIASTDELGRKTTYTYNTDLYATLASEQLTGSGAYTLQWLYDGSGRVIKEIHANAADTVEYFYDSIGRLSQKKTPYNTITYTYDVAGNIIEEKDSTGRKTTYTYDTRDNVLEKRVYINATTYISELSEYDGFDRMVKTTDGKGLSTTKEFDKNDQLIKIIGPIGDTTQYFYDNVGNTIGELLPRAYDDVSLRNTNGHTNSFMFDGAGRRVKETNAQNKQTLYLYNKDSRMVKKTDRQNADGTGATHVHDFVYDALGHMTKETDAHGFSVQYGYDAVGNRTSLTDQMNRKWLYIYDGQNRIIEEQDPAGLKTLTSYDPGGNRISVTDADGNKTTYAYDAENRLTKITDDLSNTRTYTYDGVGNILSQKDKLGNVSTLSYDFLNRLVTEKNPDGTDSLYTYDKNNNRTEEKIVDSKTGIAKITTITFDGLNRVVLKAWQGTVGEEYTYDKESNVIKKSGGTYSAVFQYDALNRPVKKDQTGGSTTYTYDQWGNLLSRSGGAESGTFTYDNENRELTEQKQFAGLSGKTYTITRTYHADGQVATLTDAGGKKITYTYNTRGLLLSAQDGATILVSYDYTGVQKPKTATYGNGVKTTYTYDDLARINTVNIEKATQTLFSHTYTYDAESNRSALTEGVTNPRTVTYAYDKLGQMTAVNYGNVGTGNDITFAYDAWGNRVSVDTPFGATDYTFGSGSNLMTNYSVNGRLVVDTAYTPEGLLATEVHKRLGVSVKKVEYEWDSLHRLKSATYTRLSQPLFMPGLPSQTVLYAYDDAGNRVKKEAQGKVTYYVNDGLSVLNEMNGAGAVTKTMISALGPVAEIQGNSSPLYIHQDAVGSTVLMTDALGAVVAEYEYDVFGSVLGYQGTKETEYLFTAQELDGESELYYFNARYYNPQMGRFISRDTFMGRDGDVVSKNRFAYVKNNPLKYVDPSGEEEECFICFDVTADLIWKLKTNGLEMKNEYVKDEKAYDDMIKEAEKLPWWLFGVKSDLYSAANDVYLAERASTYWIFYKHVKPGGDWDYKLGDYKIFGKDTYKLAGVLSADIDYETRGNINFSFTGRAAGIPETTLKTGAGMAQIAAWTSEWGWYDSYFDDPKDQKMISVGIKLYDAYGLNINEEKLGKALQWYVGGGYIVPPGWDSSSLWYD